MPKLALLLVVAILGLATACAPEARATGPEGYTEYCYATDTELHCYGSMDYCQDEMSRMDPNLDVSTCMGTVTPDRFCATSRRLHCYANPYLCVHYADDTLGSTPCEGR